MTVRHLDVRRGSYHDSVTLMQVSRTVGDVDGVEAALVAMATELNLDFLPALGFDAGAVEAGPNDLLIAVRAGSDDALAQALQALEAALTSSRRPSADTWGGEPPPRTTGDAVTATGARLALVSTPGEHAFVESLDALRAGANVMIFSDNVPLEAERRLKDEAAARGLLVMGPDCGTAIVAGVGLGFANVVRNGPVGIVAASGTGAQQLTCLLDDAGIGISHVLGVGGRDLSAAVGGASTVAALRALDADPATELIVVLSKPPAPEVATRIEALAGELATPVVLGLLRPDGDDLTAVAGRVIEAAGGTAEPPAAWPVPDRAPRAGHLRGLFAGGTLASEALALAVRELGPVASNLHLEGATPLDGTSAARHVIVDLGEDEFTRGRPHPMIDPSLRLERLADETARDDTAVLLLDVVLGHGAHPDPAGDLVPAIEAAVARGIHVVVSLCGSAGDPQDRDRQASSLAGAGASVHLSNAEAAREAIRLTRGARP
ncbi:MAG: FdrA family protein [Actinobacteria bacterium]|nr:FdrA family protein [Actinomycetota bacterium]